MLSALYIVALVAGNLIPVSGVVFWQWQIALVLFIYWIETGIIALFYFLILVGGPLAMFTGKTAIIGVFVVFKTVGELFSVPFASTAWTRGGDRAAAATEKPQAEGDPE